MMTLSKPKCLIVDDLKENILALKALLSGEPMEIYAAHSGEVALELMLKHEFALALLDVQMPEMDGFELAEIMRSTEKTKTIPIIFVTAAATDSPRIFQGYEAGAVDFLHKPLFPQIVLSKVRIFLELYNQKKLLEHKVDKLRKTEAHLNAALKARDEFMSICSHELKTPLTSLKMQIQMTERNRRRSGDEGALSIDNMKKFIQVADRSVDRLIRLVNDMLDISRVNTGRLSLNKDLINLTAVTQEVSERLAPIMELASNKLLLDLESNIMIEADKFRIEQVLTNLLMNAAKYAPDSEVKVSLKKENHNAILCVDDKGPGISPAAQRRIFERFERAVEDNSVSGLGLGLFISREIIEMHQGEISLASDLGKGCTFKIKLPLKEINEERSIPSPPAGPSGARA